MSRRSQTGRLGYTVVELLMSLTVLALGASGVIAMQKVTLSTNRHARALTVATRIAEGWADQLAADSTLWTNTASPRGSTAWLQDANPVLLRDWYAPAWSDVRLYGPAFDSLGNPLNATARPGLAHFCTHLRFTFMSPETEGHGTIRAQIRVFWRREDATVDAPGDDNLCRTTGPEFDNAVDSLHAIYLTTAVRQSQRGRL
jgi:hypothetical protein